MASMPYMPPRLQRVAAHEDGFIPVILAKDA